jgi:tetratricopeptide (TPR) repeat protein
MANQEDRPGPGADPRVAAIFGEAEAMLRLGRAAEARSLFERVILAAPDNFQAGFNLALIALDFGDLDAAEQQVARLIGRHGASPPAAWLGARVALAHGDFNAVIARLAPVLGGPSLTPDQRAEALLLRADALDGLGRIDEAFAATVRGKHLQRSAHAGRAAGREGEVAKLNRLADWFEAADPTAWRASPAAAAKAEAPDTHVFLVGFPRSGTTLLEQVLAGHPDVCALEEAPTFAEHYAAFMASARDLDRLAQLSPGDADHWRTAYWRAVRQFHPGLIGRVFLDKAPAGTLYLPLIAKLFPDAKVLFAVRDPRDVTLSCFRNNFQLNAMTYAFTDLGQTAACYAACMRMASAYRAILPLTIRDVRHEALVRDIAGELPDLCAFLGLQVTDDMADVAGTAARRMIRTPSARQVRSGLNSTGLERWRAYAAYLEPVMPTLAPWIERFGYSAT